MQRLKLFGIAMLAIFAFTAVMASTAAAKPEFLDKPIGNKIKTGKGGAGRLETLGGTTIKCGANTVLGELTGNETGLIDVHFEKCTALGFPTNSLGDAKEVILTGSVTFKLCYISEAEKDVGIYLEGINVHAEIPLAGVLINIVGSIIGLIKPINTLTAGPYTITFSQTKGDQAFTKCTLLGKELKASLTASKDAKHEKTESASIEQIDEITFERDTEIMA